MASVWDNWDIYSHGYDPKTGQYFQNTPEQRDAAEAEAARRRRAARNTFIKAAVYGTAGTLAGGYGLSALAGAGGGGVAGPAGWTPGWEDKVPSIFNAAGGGGGGGGGVGGGLLGRGLTGRDFATLGSAGVGALTSIYGTHQANSAADRAMAEQAREFAEQQKFLAEQAKLKRDDELAIEAEKKRQWEAEQAEKIRQWEAMQPWRDAGQANLTRMNSLMDMPSTQRLDLSTLRRG